MFTLLLPILTIMAGSFFFQTVFHRKFGESTCLYLFFLILVIYGFGLFVPLNIVSIGIMLVTLFSIPISCYFFYKQEKKEKCHFFKQQSLWIWCIGIVFFYCLDQGKVLYFIDDFTHWGDVVKAMYLENHLSIQCTNLLYGSYPPSISIIEYFFLFLSSTWNESILYFAYHLFGLSLLLPFLEQKISFKRLGILLGILLLVPIVFYDNYYYTILVDPLLGILFSLLALRIYQFQKMNIFDITILVLGVMVLTLLKDAGIFFAILCLFLYMVTQFKNRKNKKIIFGGILLFFGIALARGSWSLALYMSHTTIQHQNMIDISILMDCLWNRGADIYIQIRNQFFKFLSQTTLISSPVSLSYIGVVITIGVLFYGLYRYKESKLDRIKYRNWVIVLMVGAFVYIFFLFITYLFQFKMDEALGMSSFYRYICIYANALLFILLFFFISNEISTKKLGYIFMLLCIMVPVNRIANVFYYTPKVEERYSLMLASTVLKEKDTILIYGKNNKEEFAKVNYYLRPHSISSDLTVRGSHFIANIKDIELISSYQYFYILNKNALIDEEIKKRYGIIPKEFCLYKIGKDKLEEVKIENIE